LILHVTVFNNG